MCSTADSMEAHWPSSSFPGRKHNVSMNLESKIYRFFFQDEQAHRHNNKIKYSHSIKTQHQNIHCLYFVDVSILLL